VQAAAEVFGHSLKASEIWFEVSEIPNDLFKDPL
jgi:hypothetical protein